MKDRLFALIPNKVLHSTKTNLYEKSDVVNMINDVVLICCNFSQQALFGVIFALINPALTSNGTIGMGRLVLNRHLTINTSLCEHL